MTPEEQNQPVVLNDKPTSAWEAAAGMGIDMSLIESNLKATPDQRAFWHDSALKLMLEFERVAKEQHG
jgi:hypothetical protein